MLRFLQYVSVLVLDWGVAIGGQNAHEAPADERQEHHEGPVGNGIEEPNGIGPGHGKAIRVGPTLEGMESTGMDLDIFLAVIVNFDDVFTCGGGEVEAPDVNGDVGRGGKHIEDPQNPGSGRPGIAQDRLIFAVQHGQVRWVVTLGKGGGRFIPGRLQFCAASCRGFAKLVLRASGCRDWPI